MTHIVCQQLAPQIGDFAANLERSLAAIEDARAGGAELIVLPELATSGYVFESSEEAAAMAISADHPVLAEWARAAAPAVVVGGFAERGSDGVLYNSAALLDGSAAPVVYRKTHLWDREKLFFAPGPTLPPVVPTRIGNVAVMICYDLEFPELTRAVALAGAELIAVPTNWPLLPRPENERAPEVTIAMAAARVNRVAVACADRAGTERGQPWTEGTTIIDADGWIAAAAGPGVATASADLDLHRARDKTHTVLAHAFDDRRPDLYGSLTAAPLAAVTPSALR